MQASSWSFKLPNVEFDPSRKINTPSQIGIIQLANICQLIFTLSCQVVLMLDSLSANLTAETLSNL